MVECGSRQRRESGAKCEKWTIVFSEPTDPPENYSDFKNWSEADLACIEHILGAVLHPCNAYRHLGTGFYLVKSIIG